MRGITELLARAGAGDGQAANALYAKCYPEIKRIARARLSEAGGVTGLDATALVHEGFLRMADSEGLRGSTRGQFFAYVGRVLRTTVIDHLRARNAQRRGGDALFVTLSHGDAEYGALGQGGIDLAELDAALARMRELDGGLYELIEMTAFAGMGLDEIAQLRQVSTRTINRDLLKARALLAELMQLSDGAGVS
ncbi:ECF-type sigma factor [Dokdonella sp.]|uniref:ECF-type sigma factor n=1 Tax=Dokdonella sp. TaxID=2291710 RepID=UPI0025BD110B|nr:ECF-type sigma factor [Dokdonella sp.]MBX3690490.1 sigma-70 family RNA polymerase sigma factor [Dokdonella sp.]